MSTCSDESCDKECPLCMETLELDDINFYPCKCEYQICRFCWHRIRTDENGLCPACRQPYPEDPVNFKPMTTDDVRKHKDEQRLKKQAEKLKLSDARQYLCNYRVLQKNLVYVVGLSPRVADPEILKKNEYFGRYGKIQKIVTSATPSLPAPHLPPSHTAYVTYKRVDDALRAIQGVHNSMLDGRLVKASLGTTKYCSSFLNSRKCFKPVGECMYLHENAEAEISFTKDDMHLGKHTEYEKRLIESMNSRPPPPQSTLASQLDKILAPTSNSPRRYLEDDSDTVDDVERTGSAIHMCADDPDDDDADSTNTSNSIDDPAPSNPADETVNSRRSNQTARERQWSERDEISVAPSNTPPTDPEGNENEFEEDIHRNDVSDLMSKLDVNDDRLARTSFSENDYLGIPAPAKHQEAPAPLMQWEALLGLSSPSAQSTIVEPSSLFPTFKMDSGFNSQSLFGTHTSSTPSFRREASPPPGLARFNSDDDLGFDPFTESSKGLSALLQEEQEQIPPHNSASNHTLDVLKHSRLFGQLPEQRQSTQQHPQHLQSSHQQHPLQQNQDQHHSFLHQLHAQQQHQQQQFAADMNRQQDYMYSRLMSQQQQQSQQQRQFDSTPGFSHPFGSVPQCLVESTPTPPLFGTINGGQPLFPNPSQTQTSSNIPSPLAPTPTVPPSTQSPQTTTPPSPFAPFLNLFGGGTPGAPTPTLIPPFMLPTLPTTAPPTTPSPVDVCSLPPVTGSCSRARIMWYYDNESRRCERFSWSGCGNQNRFASKMQCEQTCSQNSLFKRNF